MSDDMALSITMLALKPLINKNHFIYKSNFKTQHVKICVTI